MKIFNKDIFDLLPSHTKCDAVIACPPWGGIDVSRY